MDFIFGVALFLKDGIARIEAQPPLSPRFDRDPRAKLKECNTMNGIVMMETGAGFVTFPMKNVVSDSQELPVSSFHQFPASPAL